mmetsp:Transcript_44764/g.108556  ORF Transcript_44764/g.108556 Transcript_44764/m.108556 type:complete len:797 (-) Transcript_44764:35-2425(-)
MEQQQEQEHHPRRHHQQHQKEDEGEDATVKNSDAEVHRDQRENFEGDGVAINNDDGDEDDDDQETRTPAAVAPSFGQPTSFGVSSTTIGSKTTTPSSGSTGGVGLFSFSAASFALPKTDSANDNNTTTKTTFSSSTPSSAGTRAFPPIAKNAPTPFGSNPTSGSSTIATNATTTSSSAESVQSSTKASSSVPAVAAAAAASFPPMSTKAPTPFGQSKLTLSSSSTTASPVPSSVLSAFPPMSDKAPTPFGQSKLTASSSSKPSITSSSTSAAFPPMSTIAPKKPFGGSAGYSEVTAGSAPVVSLTKSTDDKDKSSPTIDYRTRLIEFYKKHNPSKVDSVDDTLAKYKGKEEEMFRKLRNKYESGNGSDKAGASASKFPLPGGDGPTCYIDFSIDNDPAGRVVFKLYADKAPLCAENFRCLCTGEKGEGQCYKNSKVHRVVPSFVVQLGDYTKGDGTGGRSIYQPGEHGANMWGKFKDEPFMQHSRPGLLSMANSGPNSNSSQFFITLRATPHLDGKHTIFGEVVEGMDIVDRIVDIPTDKKSLPVKPVVVADCGEIKNGVDYPAAMVSAAPKSSPFGTSSTFGASSNNASGSSGNTMSFSSLASGNNSSQASGSPAFGGFGSNTPSTGFGGGSGSTSIFGGTSSLGGVNTSSTAFGTSTNSTSHTPTGFGAFGSGTANAKATSGTPTSSTFGGSTSFGKKETLSSTAFGSISTNGNTPSFGAVAAGTANTSTDTKTESKSASSTTPSPFGAFSQNNGSTFSFGSTAASASNDKPSPFSAFSGNTPSAFNFKPSTAE